MPLIEKDTYHPPFYFRNAHFNTIYSSLMRKAPKHNYRRSLIRTLDDDIVVVDRLAKGNPKLAIMCHGLEGSSNSTYLRGMAAEFLTNGYDILALNFRSCGGIMNRQLRMYHSGDTKDLEMVIKYHQNAYQSITLIGFSLGGNVILKYLGEDPSKVHHKIKAAIAISVPIDLKAASLQIGGRGNYLYQEIFLKNLFKKVREKQRLFPDKVNLSNLGKVKSLMDFDNYYTAPLHGFKDAEDYYQKTNSKQFLFDIQIPTLLLNAKDDPFLSPSCFPEDLAKHSKSLFFHAPKYGGHVGFSNPGRLDYHVESALDFLKGLE